MRQINTPPFRFSMFSRIVRIIYLALLTVFVSNFSFHPFGTSFRFSLAVGAFTFFLLLNDDINPILGGIVTGLAILAFRAGGNALLLELPLPKALDAHFPAAVFYLLLGFGMWLTGGVLRDGKWSSFAVLGLLDVSANIGELAVRQELLGKDILAIIYLLSVVALMRSSLVGLAYTAWRQHDHIITQQQRQREFERMLLITSDVSGELLYLESALSELEKIMLRSYQLYSRLSNERREEGDASLSIARDIHDAKKDFERLALRLRQVLVKQQEDERVGLATLVNIAVRANKAVAEHLKKHIEFSARVVGDTEISSYHILLSIINNLMGNAIEAIGAEGKISLFVGIEAGSLLVIVEDTGVGIEEDDLSLIFSPGYTTKFDPETGRASTGLGLVQVKHIVEKLGGSIEVKSNEGIGSSFSVAIPLNGGL